MGANGAHNILPAKIWPNHSTLKNKSAPRRVGVNLGVHTGGLFRPPCCCGGGVFKTMSTLFSVPGPFLPFDSVSCLPCHLFPARAFAAEALSLKPCSSIWSAALSPLRFASRDDGLPSLCRDCEDEDAVLKKLRSSRTSWSLLDGAFDVGPCAGEPVALDVPINCEVRGLACLSACLEMAADRGGVG